MTYKFGIIVRKNIDGATKTIGVCSCGNNTEGTAWQSNFHCDKCGNEYFVDAKNQYRERFTVPYLEASRKDNRGFKLKRVNLSVKYNSNDISVTPIKENLKREMEYDIVDNVLKIWRNGELEFDADMHGTTGYYADQANKIFFTQLDENLFFNFISNEVTRGIYKVAKKLSENGFNRKRHVLKGLMRLSGDYKWIQILASAGVPEVDRFVETNRHRRHTDNSINVEATKPHEILNVPKFMMSYIREDLTINRDVLRNLQGHFKKVETNKLREIMSIVKDEGSMRDLSNCIDVIMQIHIDYEYLNLKKLVLYLFREVRLTQGIESPVNASTYLRDYIRMSKHMELEFEKYPKSLKKEHDVIQMNYNMINASEEQNKLFKFAVEKKSYQSLEYNPDNKKEKYAIVIPETPEDLVKEGNQLSHCVASYVNDVNNDRCKILFLREKEELNKPLATIEVRGLNIRQARGFANRAITEEQRSFIKSWAEKNNLVEAYY